MKRLLPLLLLVALMADEALALTPRWTPLRPHPEQIRLINSRARFRIVPAGRRSGKTERAKRHLVIAALECPHVDGRFVAGAPTTDQARRIFWRDLKALVPSGFVIGRPNETRLEIRLINGAMIEIVGLDKPERIEGSPLDGIIVDEFGNVKPHAWERNIRPALSTEGRPGWAWLFGVPEGRNHYYDRVLKARADRAERGDASEWDVFHWISADIVDAHEIEQARRDMDALVFRQEYEASFETFAGRAYYNFDVTIHGAKSLPYNRRAPLLVCLDFNTAPGVAVIAQDLDDRAVGVIGEVHIERGSNSEMVARRIITDWSQHDGQVLAYGDATGGAKKTSSLAGSDWDIINRELRNAFGGRYRQFVRKSNPSERSRVNHVNSLLRNAAGETRVYLDPVKAPMTVKDFDNTTVVSGGSGEIHKPSGHPWSHWTDAFGYMVVERFPMPGTYVPAEQDEAAY